MQDWSDELTALVAANAAKYSSLGDHPPAPSVALSMLNPVGPDLGKAVLNFDANATTLNTASTGTLSAVVAYLQANPAAHVALTGAGVDAGRIATANFGEAYPVTDNANPQACELNRRVEITLAE